MDPSVLVAEDKQEAAEEAAEAAANNIRDVDQATTEGMLGRIPAQITAARFAAIHSNVISAIEHKPDTTAPATPTTTTTTATDDIIIVDIINSSPPSDTQAGLHAPRHSTEQRSVQQQHATRLLLQPPLWFSQAKHLQNGRRRFSKVPTSGLKQRCANIVVYICHHQLALLCTDWFML